MSRQILIDDTYTKIIATTTDTVIQNTGQGYILISVQDYDIKPTLETGFIRNSGQSIKIPSGKHVYGKSRTQHCSIEVVEC